MRLIKVGCSGFKRFREEAEMDVDDKLIAIVGPNEAGKSSFLSALQFLEDGGALDDSARTRNADVAPEVWARYVLESGDRMALSNIPEAQDVKQFIVRRDEGGVRYEVIPDVSRDLASRTGALALLDRALKLRWLKTKAADDEFLVLIREAREVLADTEEDIDDDRIQRIVALADRLEGNGSKSVPKSMSGLRAALAHEVENERREHPRQTVINRLEALRPRFLLFTARELRSVYNFSEPTGAALTNLLSLAATTWASVAEASRDPGRRIGLEEATAEVLDRRFAAWTQSALTVRLSIDGSTLSVVVRMDAVHDYLGIGDHSDGLRQFVALLAQIAADNLSGIPPVVLIDEAEMHLHYDAQADLVQVFETQEQAAKVIYTTHSAGCLPQDLGRGVRLIEPIRGTDDSRVVNWFWTQDPSGAGFSPILIGMGASAFAFAATRRAVIAEGATDAMLLPTLFRQATGLDRLGYQIAPGLANVSAEAIVDLDLVAARVVYLLDRDASGDAKAKLLASVGVPQQRIVRLGTSKAPLVLEDLVDPVVYLDAVNAELARWGSGVQIPPSAIPARQRPAAVNRWCASRRPVAVPPTKRAVAQRILERAADLTVVSEKRRAVIEELHAQVVELLDQPSHVIRA